ncbi:MAG: DUF996 domain-containing protein [Nitrososphaerota archaeon]|jgi:uncharacterized membrane protein|nr:DUF996 domain-containing protein [Nitrososphaerota archaeon]
MTLLSSSRSTGVIGSILALLIIIPGVGTVLAIIGWILVLVAVNQLSHLVGDRSIVNNVLISTILTIVGLVAGAVAALGSVFRFLNLNGMTGFGPFSMGVNATAFVSTSDIQGFGGLVVGILVGLAVLWVCLLAAALFLRRGYDRLAATLNTRMFNTSALIFLIGAALTIVGIGLVIVFIAEILQAIAFYTIPDEVPGQSVRPVPMTVPPPPPQV